VTDEQETRWKSDGMMGADDGSSETTSGKKKPMGTGFLGHLVNLPKHGQVDQCKIQAVVRNKRNYMHTFKGYNDQK
jgi:hypothetical protein